jgi:hypothetical protein
MTGGAVKITLGILFALLILFVLWRLFAVPALFSLACAVFLTIAYALFFHGERAGMVTSRTRTDV